MKDPIAVFLEPPKRVPTRQMVDGPLLGNGDLGVTLSGPPDKLKFWISKNDFWRAAERIVDGSRFGKTLGAPCCITALGVYIDRIFQGDYRLEQDIGEAEVRGEFHTSSNEAVTLRAWVPANENLLIIEVTSPQDAWLDFELETRTGHRASSESGYDEHGFAWLRRSFRQGVLWPSEAAVCVRRLDCGDAPGWHHKMLEAGKTATLVVVVRSNHETGGDFMAAAERRAREITLDDVEELRGHHRNWWADFWTKSSVEIGDDLLEKAWYGAHYIMACCSRNREFPPGIFGNWLTTDEAYWAGDYHLNYNYQAPWWGVFSSNHVELAEPYDAPMMAFIPRGRESAKTLLGCRGIYYEVGLGPKGLSTADLYHGQKSNASYVAVNMIMRYEYTRDLDYARGIAYPFLIEVANFWEDYLEFENGRYVIYKDAIHENVEDHEDFNPVLSLGFVRMVMKTLLELSGELDLDAGRREKWQHILDHVSEFPTYERGGKTIFRLTESGMEWCDGNTLAIQHIFPAGCIGLDSDPELLEVARNTVAALARWKCGNGFPTFYTAAARVGHDPREILEQLHERVEADIFPNLLIFQGGGGIETCGGITEAINEMLLQSHEGIIRLFPVWPTERPARFETLRAAGAFLVSAELRGGEVGPVMIESEKGRDCTVQNPWPDKEPAAFELEDGKKIPVDIGVTGDRYTFKTRPGARYVVEAKASS